MSVKIVTCQKCGTEYDSKLDDICVHCEVLRLCPDEYFQQPSPSDCPECGGSSTSKGKFACICDHIGDANEMISDHIPDAKQMVPAASERARELVDALLKSAVPLLLRGAIRYGKEEYDAMLAFIAALEAEFVTREADFEILKTYAETMAEKCDALQASVTRLTAERNKYRRSMENTGWTFEGESPMPPLGNPPPFIYEERIDAATKRADALQASLDYLIRDTCEDDTDIRNLCRPFLTEQTCDHDGYAVVPIQDVVANVIDVLKKRAEAAERERDEWIAKWTATAKERNDSEALVREVAEFGCLFITPSPSGEQCGCINCKCRAFVAKEQA